jgi:hypothetical protein
MLGIELELVYSVRVNHGIVLDVVLPQILGIHMERLRLDIHLVGLWMKKSLLAEITLHLIVLALL